jgi:mannose-1-phosphate guanylyltransferase
MRAILLAAGFGTRLRPLTNNVPKCLVTIKGKPLIQIWLEKLKEINVSPVLVNTHYLSSKVDNFIKNSPFADHVSIVFEPVLLGTAGTLINNLDFFQNQDGLLIHGDNYCLADFKSFLKAHETRPAHCLMTMMLFHTDNPTECGIVELDNENTVIGFHEKVKDPPGNLANGAVYILSNSMLEILKNDFWDKTDFSTEILLHFLGKIHTFVTNETFIDIGTISNYEKANRT